MQIEEKKHQIIQASIEVFGSYGYKKTSMQDIADALDISRPALYQYYKNKESVFLALVDHTLNLGEQAAIKGFGYSEDCFDCLLHGIIDMELVLFEPIFLQPNGKELLTLSKKIAPELMADFEVQFFKKVLDVFKKSQTKKLIDFKAIGMEDTVKLVLSGVDGIKNSSSSLEELEKQLRMFLTIFWRGLLAQP